MKRIAWAALATTLFFAGSAFAQLEPIHRVKGVHACQDQSQETRPGPKPAPPGRPYRGNPNGQPLPQGGRPEGPVGPSFSYGSSIGQFNSKAYQGNWNATQRYHNGTYVSPQGWHYQRWTYGQVLPAMFWAQNYWISSWANFGLMAPPFGYQWVRYGNDAILVEASTGQILQVQYGVFY